MSWTDPRTGLTHYPPSPDRYIRAVEASPYVRAVKTERERRRAALDEIARINAQEGLYNEDNF